MTAHGTEILNMDLNENSWIQADSAGQIIVIFMHISGQNLVSFDTLKLQSKTSE